MTHLHVNSTLLTPDTVLSHNEQFFSLLFGAQAMVITVSPLLPNSQLPEGEVHVLLCTYTEHDVLI